ncbi:MAG: SDR family NAD(P)-dependent oxidoreductase, partial [Mesorhizobium sp.]
MAERLSGKRIFLTGAAQGIGLAIAEACLAEGAKLFLVDQDGTLLEKTVAGLAAPKGHVGHATADISNGVAIKAAVARANTEIGPVNALINNAGMNVFSTPLEATEEEWTRNFDVNVKGAWNCSKAVLPGMLANGGGAILNIASTHGFTIIP